MCIFIGYEYKVDTLAEEIELNGNRFRTKKVYAVCCKIVVPRASKTRDVIAKLPLASLLLETDAPDMPLNGFQGQPNRPEQAARVFAVLCELRLEPADEIAEVLLNNTYTLFNVL